MVTIMNKAKPNHPKIMAVVPTPDLTLPFPKSWAIVLAATDAVCCHSTETRTKTEATKMRARATCDTGLEGKGLTSRSEPRSSVSSCQPGKVARRMKQTKARTIATILQRNQISANIRHCISWGSACLHQIWEHYAVLERAGDPDEIQWVLIDTDLACETAGIVAAQEGATVCINADTEIAHSDFKLRLSHNICNRCCDSRVDLCRIEYWRIVFVIEGDEEYVGYAR